MLLRTSTAHLDVDCSITLAQVLQHFFSSLSLLSSSTFFVLCLAVAKSPLPLVFRVDRVIPLLLMKRDQKNRVKLRQAANFKYLRERCISGLIKELSDLCCYKKFVRGNVLCVLCRPAVLIRLSVPQKL